MPSFHVFLIIGPARIPLRGQIPMII